MLLDVSGSVEAKFGFEKESASRFITQVLKTGDRSAIFAIDQEPRLEQGLDTAARATSKLTSISPSKEATAFFDTVIDAARYLAKSAPPEHRRVIVVISDGEDNYSENVKKAIGSTSEEQNAATAQARHLVQNKMLLEVQRNCKGGCGLYSINRLGPGLRLT